MVVRLIISYLGHRYCGWQRQPNGRTVQATVEQALSELTRQTIVIHGASRTDTGVHAERQAAHLKVDPKWSLRALVHGTNHRLPNDIRILSADRMCDGFHARIRAVGKSYAYRLWQGQVVPPIKASNTVATYSDLDLEAMRRATRRLVGEHDFSAFAKAGGSHNQPVRRVFSATIEPDGQEALTFRCLGNGFLRGMVRALVGTVVEVGRGRLTVSAVERLLLGGSRAESGPSAPANGLTLERVFYSPRDRALESYGNSSRRPADVGFRNLS